MKKVFLALSLLMGLTMLNGAKGESCSRPLSKMGCTIVDIASSSGGEIGYMECSGRIEHQSLEGELTLCVSPHSFVKLYLPFNFFTPYFTSTVSGPHVKISCIDNHCQLTQ